VGRKEESYSPHESINNAHATREAWIVGYRYQNLCLEVEKKAVEEVENSEK
jgi:hypothetical protein